MSQKWSQREWSVKEIDQHLEEFDQKNGPEMAQRVNNSDLCALYIKYGPILKFAANFLFFNRNWKKGYLIFIQALDTNCDIVDPS